MSNCVISVIIPVCNEEHYIARTLQCFKNQQTDIPFEVIVCDNNCSDHTIDIARTYADRIVYEKKQGIACARNTGARHAQGDYLVFADADTLYPADFIQKTYAVFTQQSYVAFCGGKYCYDPDDPHLRVSLRLKAAHLCYAVWCSAPATYLLEKTNTLIVPGFCLCTPRSVFEHVGGFDERTKAHDDVHYSWKIRPLGTKKYIGDLRVRSSIRRAEQGLISLFRYHFNIHNILCACRGLLRGITPARARHHPAWQGSNHRHPG